MRVMADHAGLRLGGIWGNDGRHFGGSRIAVFALDLLGQITLLYPGQEALGGMAASAIGRAAFRNSQIIVAMPTFLPLLETPVPGRLSMARRRRHQPKG